jgi:hypothetical protein
VVPALVCREDQDVGIGPEGEDSLALKWGVVATGGEGFGKIGLGDMDRMWEM